MDDALAFWSIIISFLLGLLGGSSGLYLAVKRFLADLSAAVEDNRITPQELKTLVRDGWGIWEIIRQALRRK